MKAKIQSMVKDAMRARNQSAMDTLRILLTAIQYEEIQKGVEPLPEEQIIEVVKRELKKKSEELDFAKKGSREELIAKVGSEINLLESFLPAQLSREELTTIIKNHIGSNPGSNIGSIMQMLKQSHSGKYDSKLASEVAKGVLG